MWPFGKKKCGEYWNHCEHSTIEAVPVFVAPRPGCKVDKGYNTTQNMYQVKCCRCPMVKYERQYDAWGWL